MKICMKYLVGIIVSVSCLCDANAAATKICPAGLFCTSGGKYNSGQYGIESYKMGPADLVTSNWGDWQEEGLCSKGKCAYSAENYDQVWVSTWFGFYMVKNGDVTYHSSGSSAASGVFPCPGTHPSSAEGASSVFECYRNVGNGQKEYYKAPNAIQTNNAGNADMNTIAALVQELQASLNQANKIAADLQKALNKSTKKNTASASNVNSSADIESMKALISAGLSEAKSVTEKKPIGKLRK